MICSLMIGIDSFGRTGILKGSARGVGGVLPVSTTKVLFEPVVTSDRGEWTTGNLKSERAGDGAPRVFIKSMFGVFGTEGRWKGESRPGG